MDFPRICRFSVGLKENFCFTNNPAFKVPGLFEPLSAFALPTFSTSFGFAQEWHFASTEKQKWSILGFFRFFKFFSLKKIFFQFVRSTFQLTSK
jgi:hypothetical protein